MARGAHRRASTFKQDRPGIGGSVRAADARAVLRGGYEPQTHPCRAGASRAKTPSEPRRRAVRRSGTPLSSSRIRAHTRVCRPVRRGGQRRDGAASAAAEHSEPKRGAVAAAAPQYEPERKKAARERRRRRRRAARRSDGAERRFDAALALCAAAHDADGRRARRGAPKADAYRRRAPRQRRAATLLASARAAAGFGARIAGESAPPVEHGGQRWTHVCARRRPALEQVCRVSHRACADGHAGNSGVRAQMRFFSARAPPVLRLLCALLTHYRSELKGCITYCASFCPSLGADMC
eukprot:IDg16443t1